MHQSKLDAFLHDYFLITFLVMIAVCLILSYLLYRIVQADREIMAELNETKTKTSKSCRKSWSQDPRIRSDCATIEIPQMIDNLAAHDRRSHRDNLIGQLFGVRVTKL